MLKSCYKPLFLSESDSAVKGNLGGTSGKNSPSSVGETWRRSLDQEVGRRWQHTSVFLLDKSHGQRSLLGYT